MTARHVPQPPTPSRNPNLAQACRNIDDMLSQLETQRGENANLALQIVRTLHELEANAILDIASLPPLTRRAVENLAFCVASMLKAAPLQTKVAGLRGIYMAARLVSELYELRDAEPPAEPPDDLSEH